MSRTVVIWSGGLDSTLCLYLAGLTSSKSNPVVTYSIRNHYLVNRYQTAMQTKARNKYLKWARSNGHFISPVYLDVGGNIKPECLINNYSEDGKDIEKKLTIINQKDAFSSLLVPYFNNGDTVIWGWKNYEFPGNSFFKRLKDLSLTWTNYAAKVEHVCPLKNLSCDDVADLIRSSKIPYECFYCCDHVSKKPRPGDKVCECQKCQTMQSVFHELAPIDYRLYVINNKMSILRTHKEALLWEKNNPNKKSKVLRGRPNLREAYRLLGI